MKELLKSRIFLVIVCAIVFTNVGVIAGNIQASNVSYGNTTLDNALDTLYSTQSTTVTNLQNQVSSNSTTISNLQQSNETLSGQVSTLTTQNQTLTGQVNSLTSSNQQLQSQINELTNAEIMDLIDFSLKDAHAERNISTANNDSILSNLNGNYIVIWTDSKSIGSTTAQNFYNDIIGTAPDGDRSTFVVTNGECQEIFGKQAGKTAVTAYSGSYKMWNEVSLKIYKCTFTSNGSAKLTFKNGNINTYNTMTDILASIKID